MTLLNMVEINPGRSYRFSSGILVEVITADGREICAKVNGMTAWISPAAFERNEPVEVDQAGHAAGLESPRNLAAGQAVVSKDDR